MNKYNENICKHFKNDNCKWGDKCKISHKDVDGAYSKVLQFS